MSSPAMSARGDQEDLIRLVVRWSWIFGLLAATDVLSLAIYVVYLDAGKAAFPAPLNVVFYVFLTAITMLAFGARLRAQLNLRQAELEHGRLRDMAMLRLMVASLREDVAKLADAVAGYESQRDRRDGLLYRGLSVLRTGQGLIGRAVTELVEREPVTAQLPVPRTAVYVGSTAATAQVIDRETLEQAREVSRRLRAVED